MPKIAAVSRQKSEISRQYRGEYFEKSQQSRGKIWKYRDFVAVNVTPYSKDMLHILQSAITQHGTAGPLLFEENSAL